jgi:hypothetical protein
MLSDSEELSANAMTGDRVDGWGSVTTSLNATGEGETWMLVTSSPDVPLDV